MTPLEALDRAIADLDAAWDLSASKGLRDPRGSAEYRLVSPVPALHALRTRVMNDERPA